eukprot:m.210801 g.210801  ORF g.210801 m.210801 type:complete len:278 (+) comp26132_c2_seq2:434-1267(+)
MSDFPALGGSSSTDPPMMTATYTNGFKKKSPKSKLKAPPPGFTPAAKPARAPPPGLGPPPGLATNSSTPPKSLSNGASPPLSNTNKTTQNAVPHPVTSAVPPATSEERKARNLRLVQTVKALLGDQFGTFKTISQEFRQDVLSAPQYYRQCSDLFGSSLSQVFPELVALLPDETKRNALQKAFSNKAKTSVPAKHSTLNQTKPKAPPGISITMNAPRPETRPCPQCGRPLTKPEWKQHLASHAQPQVSEDAFPSLPSAAVSKKKQRKQKPKGAWARR